MISVHSCVWGKIPVHLPEEWRFRCIHVWGIRFRCIYLRDIDFSAFMCEGMDQGAFTWRVTISVHSCVRGTIPVHLPEESWFRCIHVWSFRISVHVPEEWRFRCIHVWGVRLRCIYLRDDDFGAFMCKGWDFSAYTWRVTISVRSCVRGRIPVHLLEEWWFWCIHVWGVRFRCIYLRDDDFGAFMCEG